MRNGNTRPLPVAVIGGGFSGVATAIQLGRLGDEGGVMLFDSGPGFGQGVAYAATGVTNWLNVPAHNMSLDPDAPSDFAEWLAGTPGIEAGITESPVGVFAQRPLYGRYLASRLESAAAAAPDLSPLRRFVDEVVDIIPAVEHIEIVCASGRCHLARAAVLALGNLAKPLPDAAGRIVHAWDPRALDGLSPGLPVLMIGTGLTTVDIIAALSARGFPGDVIAVSRRGLLPRQHRKSPPWPTPELTAEEGRSVVTLLRRVRAEIRHAEREGADWRAVIDGMRPVTTHLWSGLERGQRSRFIRHLQPWWDVHRHRMPPPPAEAVERMAERGRFRVLKGRLLRMQEDADSVTVELRGRGTPRAETLRVQRVIRASGFTEVATAQSRLVERLVARGLVRFDSLGISFDVGDDLRVRDAQGRTATPLWALGPVVRGAFWECTSVPDIRHQAKAVAQSVLHESMRVA